jgi:hypothetical protein
MSRRASRYVPWCSGSKVPISSVLILGPIFALNACAKDNATPLGSSQAQLVSAPVHREELSGFAFLPPLGPASSV